MRLIEEGFLNEASVAELADRLGIGPRHLLRLFVRHTGATPTEVAATRRVQRAKRLLDETEMPMSETPTLLASAACDALTMPFGRYRRPPSSFRAI
jgi:AraC family transcriptional regulator, regulatory protein of adaptative response / methylated-DNA-[protein]-cysteine methyltransferase